VDGTTSVWLVLEVPYGRTFSLDRYAITSANDRHERDPSAWRLEVR
jgi:hypothetical protein